MSIWDSLDDLGSTIVDTASGVVDAVGDKYASILADDSPDANDKNVSVDSRTVPQESGPNILGFVTQNPQMVALFALGGIAIYAILKK